jgi:hypothetical protein
MPKARRPAARLSGINPADPRCLWDATGARRDGYVPTDPTQGRGRDNPAAIVAAGMALTGAWARRGNGGR